MEKLSTKSLEANLQSHNLSHEFYQRETTPDSATRAKIHCINFFIAEAVQCRAGGAEEDAATMAERERGARCGRILHAVLMHRDRHGARDGG